MLVLAFCYTNFLHKDIAMTKKRLDLDLPAYAYSLNRYEEIFIRLSVIFLCLILIATTLGFCGGEGIFEYTRGNVKEGIAVTYPPTLRVEDSSQLRVNIPVSSGEMTTLAINEGFFKNMRIHQILPQPLYTKFIDGNIVYYFWTKPSDHILSITWLLEPQKPGWLTAYMSTGDGAEMKVNLFVYP